MTELVLLRHGESNWNKENRFTGWRDVDLSEKGTLEASAAGRLLLQEGYAFDAAHTSVLKRAIRTLWLVLDEMDLMWLPVCRHWRLNERHYGGLEGLNKAETASEHGEVQVHLWRRSYDVPPPPQSETDPHFPGHDRRYRNLSPGEVPHSESLKDTVVRFLPYWHEVLIPAVKSGQRLLVVAHGNSLRALVKYLDDISDADIPALNIPTGIPLIYEIDDDLKPLHHYYLGNPEAVARAMDSVANQGKAQ